MTNVKLSAVTCYNLQPTLFLLRLSGVTDPTSDRRKWDALQSPFIDHNELNFNISGAGNEYIVLNQKYRKCFDQKVGKNKHIDESNRV